MYFIDERLFQGGRPGLEPHNAKLDPSITAIINLQTVEENTTLYSPLNQPGTCQIMLPIHDAQFPGITWLKMAVGLVKTLQNAGHVVYIHCRGGVSRSVMLTAAVLMKKYNYNVDTAMEVIAHVNPKLSANPRFMVGLKEWGKLYAN